MSLLLPLSGFVRRGGRRTQYDLGYSSAKIGSELQEVAFDVKNRTRSSQNRGGIEKTVRMHRTSDILLKIEKPCNVRTQGFVGAS